MTKHGGKRAGAGRPKLALKRANILVRDWHVAALKEISPNLSLAARQVFDRALSPGRAGNCGASGAAQVAGQIADGPVGTGTLSNSHDEPPLKK